MKDYPDIQEAIMLWQESLQDVLIYAKQNIQMEYIYHTTNIAESAYKIALKCGLDEKKAYVAGLLHDYGKNQKEKEIEKAHFIKGFEKMSLMGYGFIARICLTHSFPVKEFSFNDYTAYGIEDLMRTKNILQTIEYDDYDRLIQLCDIFFEGMNKVTYQERISGIKKRYNLKDEQIKALKISAEHNKKYFDEKCGCDIYEILNIK